MSFSEYLNSIDFSNEELESATNNFADENLIAQGTCSKVYKGQLLQGEHVINIVVRNGVEYYSGFKEEKMSRTIEHKNIISFSRFVSRKNGFNMIYKLEANLSLDKHLSEPTLTWMQRLKICVDVAHAISYLHYEVEENYSFIHGNIKSSKILLNGSWEPKLYGFGYAMRVKRHGVYLLTSKHSSAIQYTDPACENTRGFTHKSDVFSFGVVLFEVLFGQKASSPIPNGDNWSFAQLARLHYHQRTLDHIIDPNLRKQMDSQSLNTFSETAYYCLKENRSDRPNMDQIVEKLEVALELQHKHECPEQYLITEVQATSSNQLKIIKGKNIDRLRFRLSDIKSATKDFSDSYRIGSGGFGMVYKAKFEHFDSINSSVIEQENKDKLLKKHDTVAIKRIFSRLDTQGEQGFFAEIELLSNCRHPNVVSLLGFCDDGPEMIVIYEYASNGSLDEYLGNLRKLTNLTWAKRLQICLDIAHGLNYLHTSTKFKSTIIHRDIKSANILLDHNWVAKIADFGLSKLHNTNKQGSTMIASNIAGTEVYLDPEYSKTGKLKPKSDVYSFGVVLFEIMRGRLAHDKSYSEKGLASIARQCFEDGTINIMVDPKIKEADENIFMLNGGLNQESVEIFSKIGYQCLEETQAKRPTMEEVIVELENAYNVQKSNKDNHHISLNDIKYATKNFDTCIGEGRNWKLYEGEIQYANAYVNGCVPIVAKRWDIKSTKEPRQFLRELKVLFENKHKNIIGLAGYCYEMDEKIIVYEHASNGKLSKRLDDASLTWMKRLNIGIDIASGLEFLHEDSVEKEKMLHRDFKSCSIMLDGDWKAKLSNLEFSWSTLPQEGIEYITQNPFDSVGYFNPSYCELGYMTICRDIYALGVVLIEMLCGRLAWEEECKHHDESLGPLAQQHYENGTLDDLVFEGIKDQIHRESLTAYFGIAFKCLVSSPRASEVVIKLKEALDIQENYEIWEPKLPQDYKEIFKMSKTPEICSFEKKKTLYDMLTRGILLQQGKLWFSLGSNGEINEVVSAKTFSYKNWWLLKWQSIPESRFQKAAQIFDISNLKIQIKTKTHFLTPGVNYGVHLVFKFCGPIIFPGKRMYVNLKYTKGKENLHTNFATYREDGWMMIELCRFSVHKKDTDFEVLLESFSGCNGSGVVYIEGIEFKPIENVKYGEMEKLKRSGNDDEKLIASDKVKGKKNLMLSAMEVLFGQYKVKPFHLKPSAESRFQEAIELLPQQGFGIKCKIDSQMLSPDTDYICYLVFKLSENCHGLHFPVRVWNVLHWKNKEIGLLCFRPPSPSNLHDTDWIPEKREDGWMEVIVWKFNSISDRRNDGIPMNLKLVTYEGTMSGLIVGGLDIRREIIDEDVDYENEEADYEDGEEVVVLGDNSK